MSATSHGIKTFGEVFSHFDGAPSVAQAQSHSLLSFAGTLSSNIEAYTRPLFRYRMLPYSRQKDRGVDLVLLDLFQDLAQCKYLIDDGFTRSEIAPINAFAIVHGRSHKTYSSIV